MARRLPRTHRRTLAALVGGKVERDEQEEVRGQTHETDEGGDFGSGHFSHRQACGPLPQVSGARGVHGGVGEVSDGEEVIRDEVDGRCLDVLVLAASLNGRM
jgi:hypothetical protein